MWRTGHSLIKAKMKETDAELAGEMSGHFFFSERWYGFDDGIYAAARLLEILGSDPQAATRRRSSTRCPKGVSTPELKMPMREGEHYASSNTSSSGRSSKARASRRSTACAPTGRTAGAWCARRTRRRCWCCASMRDTAEALERIQDAFRAQLLRGSALPLPF